MLTLFAIVATAVLIAVVSRTEGAKPLALALIGVLCILLGSRVTALLTENAVNPLLVSRVMAEDNNDLSAGDSAKQNAPVPPSIEPKETEPEPEKSPATEKVTSEPLPAASQDETVSAAGNAEISAMDEAGAVLETADPGPEGFALPEQPAEPVKFITRIEYLTENRPDWLETGSTTDGDLHFIAVKGGPYSKPRDCMRELEKGIAIATKEFIGDFIGNPRASLLITYDTEDLKDRLVLGDVFEEELNTSVGLMKQVHARLRFDRAFRNELELRWNEIRATSRLLQTGMGVGIVLLLLGTLFSYFRLDTATRGYYTGRLQFAAAAAILTLVAASVLLAKWIPWM